MINCAILSIGSELLEGSVVDTNSSFLGRHLNRLGLKVCSVRMVADHKGEIVEAMKEAASKYAVVFTTGGLGPTFDDITAECSSIASSQPLKLNEEAYEHMKARLESLGVTIYDMHMHQAMLPMNARTFKNSSGTAFGFSVKVGSSEIISMPGVPHEMMMMFESEVVPYLKSSYELKDHYFKDVIFASISESEVDKAIKDLKITDKCECIINVGKGQVFVKLRSDDRCLIEDLAEVLADRFPKNFIGFDEVNIASIVLEIAKKSGRTIAVAESCTGGLISKLLTDVPGASASYFGSVTSYDNSVKKNILGVKVPTLDNFGAVSAETAKEMAQGAIKALGVDFAVSTTGIAGPDGGSEKKPVGTVYIGVASIDGNTAFKLLNLRGTRSAIRERAANEALFFLSDFISGGFLPTK